MPQTATVTQNGGPVSGKSVTISIGGGGSVSGTTDAAGQFNFTYIPPDHSAQAQLSATCPDCTNTASKTIDVLGYPMCSRDAGSLVGNPIAPASGTKTQTEFDWLDQSAHPLEFIRIHRSIGDLPVGGLGSNWSHNYAATLVGNDLQRNVLLGDGSATLFARVNTTDPWRNNTSKDSLTNVATGGWLYTQASDESRWLFDASGKLKSITQRNGWTMTLVYNSSNQLTSVTNAFGRSLQFTYNSSAQLISVTTPDASQISYSFDSASRLMGVGYPDNTSRGYVYEDARWPQALTGINDENGGRYATFTYDDAGRAISTQHAGSTQAYSVQYGNTLSSSAGSLVAGSTVDPSIYQATANITDPLGSLQTYTWQGGDGNVRLVSASGAFEGGQIASRSFGTGTTLPASETDFLGVLTTFNWDLSRQLRLSTTQASGRPEARTQTTEWHPSMRLPTLITEPGRSTAYTYDALGNKLRETITDTASSKTRTRAWTYNAQGLPDSSTDPRGGVSAYTYDTAGNVTSMTNPLGHVTQYQQYNGAGNVLQSSDPNGVITTYIYDARQRLTSASTGGETTQYSYTAAGQLTKVTRPDGSFVNFSYDAAHRLIGASDSLGSNITYTLDNAGNRTGEQIKDASGTLSRQLSRVFDALGRQQKTIGLE